MKQMNTMLVLAAVLLSVLIMFAEARPQQYAWRPQGRFGKRADNSADSEGLEDLDVALMGNKLEVLKTPAFRTEDTICLHEKDMGLYRCYRLVARDSSSMEE